MLIGIGMDKPALTSMLDAALLTEEEFALGPDASALLAYPFESQHELTGRD